MMQTLNTMSVMLGVGVIISAVVMMICERLWPYHPQKLLRKGFGTDLIMYTLVQSYVLGLVISYILNVIDSHTSIDRWQIVRSQSLGVQLVVFLILHDLYIYWFHRWQHSNHFLWRIHEAHHSTREVDCLSGSRSHALEIVINQTIEFTPILLFASPEIAVIKGAVDAIWGMYIHSNIDVRSGWLQYIINGPEMHRWHHARDEAAHNRNFATKLAIWDWMFSTAYLPKEIKPSRYGIDVEYPSNYFKQHLYGFRATPRSRT